MNKSDVPSSRRSIVRGAGVIAGSVLASRVLGFARDVVIARMFGVYVYAQAFVIAFKIPNLLRDLLGEGAANAALVPVLSEYPATGRDREFWEVANILMNLLLVVLSAVTIIGIIVSPLLVRMIAPGFGADAFQFAQTVRLNRLIFPYILLIGLTAYSAGILNSLRHFAAPALAPCLLNISIIVCALIWGEGLAGLASGVLIGGFLQLAVQIPVLYHKGYRFRLVRIRSHPAIRQIGRLMLPRAASSALYQLNNFVDTIFGSLSWIVGGGAVAAMYFSYRLIQFPLGIFGFSLSQALLPTLSCQAASQDRKAFKETLVFGLRWVLFVMVPASAGFMVLAPLVVATLFAGGRFDSYAASQTTQALFFYSIGLFAYGAARILQCGFFALKDTATPAKVAGLGLAVNIVLNGVLMFPMRVGGLALATSVSGCLCCAVLVRELARKLGGLPLKDLAVFFCRVCLAGCGMAGVCLVVGRAFPGQALDGAHRMARLAVLIVTGLAVYPALCLALRIEEADRLWRRIKKTSGGSRGL